MMNPIDAAPSAHLSFDGNAPPVGSSVPSLDVSPSVLLTLRAAACMGSTFTIEKIAKCLDAQPARVLADLQMAIDGGAPIEVRNDDSFAMSPGLSRALRVSTIPALAETWSRVLGAKPTASPSTRITPHSPSDDGPVRHSAPRIGHSDANPPGGSSAAGTSYDYGAMFGLEPVAPPSDALSSHDGLETLDAPDGQHSTPPNAPPSDDDELASAAARWLVLAQRSSAAGRLTDAITQADAALSSVRRLPPNSRRRQLEARVLCEIGRLAWRGGGTGPQFTLAHAFETVIAARALLQSEDPPALFARVAKTLAGIAYDLGDRDSLSRALDEISNAVRLLTQSGEPTEAARLLDDQASLYVRLGDPVRAAYLLEQARAVFERRAGDDAAALRESADTDHLLARLPLHAPIRPGREREALAMARDRCEAAEAAYRSLGDARALAHVWETMARVEMRAGEAGAAEKRLAEAIQVQQSVGDVVGLARSTAALAELFARIGRHDEALRVLADSIALNLEKGSPIGLAFNRRDLEALAATKRGAASDAMRAVAAQLEAATDIVGSTALPG